MASKNRQSSGTMRERSGISITGQTEAIPKHANNLEQFQFVNKFIYFDDGKLREAKENG